MTRHGGSRAGQWAGGRINVRARCRNGARNRLRARNWVGARNGRRTRGRCGAGTRPGARRRIVGRLSEDFAATVDDSNQAYGYRQESF